MIHSIIVDTAVWIDHIRMPDAALTELLESEVVLMHPLILGEIAMGRFKNRSAFLHELAKLNEPAVATDAEVLTFIERHRLYGLGLGYIDAHILLSARLTGDSMLWTRDKRLKAEAQAMNVAFDDERPKTS